MSGRIFLSVILAVFYFANPGDASVVRFNGEFNVNGRAQGLTGILSKPKGTGPFPAVVMLHGSLGINDQRDAAWAKRLVSWGYVALQVDSFHPRGLTHVVDDPDKVSFALRGMDALAAKAYLAGLEFVDGNRIAVMGWSHGGSAVIAAIKSHGDTGPFRAAIAFYPYCSVSLIGLKTPLLILTGEKDRWCPAALCTEQVPETPPRRELLLQIYPGVFHDFDWEGLDRVIQGRRMKYHREAATDAIYRVRCFLDKHLQ